MKNTKIAGVRSARRHQLLKLLTRHGYVYTEGRHWTQRHITWLRTIQFTESMLTNVFENYFNEMIYCIGRLENLDKEVALLTNNRHEGIKKTKQVTLSTL